MTGEASRFNLTDSDVVLVCATLLIHVPVRRNISSLWMNDHSLPAEVSARKLSDIRLHSSDRFLSNPSRIMARQE
ncbi:hypothetical protein PISMIDRAFT_673795 [Pisolithus microcarpus 441]|uniref:Uncharacterized protein n=1 Tax=Pisolithus microcarpus 441 TaxID=765257 RepID=A0A0C9YT27_9AGAM|nr:hypothetical protein PISMIDRAFT_673795 [Pisolithus microcarpus 441]